MGLVTYDPAAVGFDGHAEDIADLHFEDSSIRERGGSAPRDHHAHMLDRAVVFPISLPTTSDRLQPDWLVGLPIVMPPSVTVSNLGFSKGLTSSGRSKHFSITSIMLSV